MIVKLYFSFSETAFESDGKRRATKFVVEVIGAQLHGKGKQLYDICLRTYPIKTSDRT